MLDKAGALHHETKKVLVSLAATNGRNFHESEIFRGRLES